MNNREYFGSGCWMSRGDKKKMTRESLTEILLEKICYVVDILPERVAEPEVRRFLEMEAYYQQEKELARFTEKLVNIILKMQCYHRFDIYYGRWYQNVRPLELAEMIRRTVRSKDGVLNLLCKEEEMLFAVNGQTLHMSVYNPTLGAIANLSMLATAEGLFMRRAEN